MAHCLIGRYEAEIKIRIKNTEEAMSRVLKMGFKMRFKNNKEKDYCYDFPDKKLRQQGKALILRERIPFNERLLFFKSNMPRIIDMVSVDNVENADNLLNSLGFIIYMKLEKNRSMFLLDHFHIVVDSISNYGNFLEIGSMTDDESELQKLIKEETAIISSLGYKNAPIETRSYHDFCIVRYKEETT